MQEIENGGVMITQQLKALKFKLTQLFVGSNRSVKPYRQSTMHRTLPQNVNAKLRPVLELYIPLCHGILRKIF